MFSASYTFCNASHLIRDQLKERKKRKTQHDQQNIRTRSAPQPPRYLLIPRLPSGKYIQFIIIIDKKRYKDKENEMSRITSFDTFITVVISRIGEAVCFTSAANTELGKTLRPERLEMTPTLMF